MAMVINTNLASITAQRHLANSKLDMDNAMERLSSGKRINGAMDDAAGLSIAHAMESQIASLNQSVRNGNDGIAMINLAEGAMDQFSNMLTRMKELATQSANGIYSQTDRDNMNQEFTALRSEITRIANVTVYNGINVLNTAASVDYQVGEKATDQINVVFADMRASAIGGGADTIKDTAAAVATKDNDGTNKQKTTFTFSAAKFAEPTETLTLTVNGVEFRQEFVNADATGAASAANDKATIAGLASQILAANNGYTLTVGATSLAIESDAVGSGFTTSSLNSVVEGGNLGAQTISSAAKAATAMTNVDAAIEDVDTFRAKLGAKANQLEQTVGNLMTRVQYTAAAKSQIMDADYAIESANLAKAQVLQQAGTAMLAQANASTQNVLSLLK